MHTMDEKITSSAYVIGLYKDVETLNDQLASYKNLLIQVSPQVNQSITISEQQQQQLSQNAEAIRFLLIRSNIKVLSLCEKVDSFKKFAENNKTRFEEIINSKLPIYDNLFQYVVELNSAFINGFSAEFFSKVGQVYDDYSMTYNNAEDPDATNSN